MLDELISKNKRKSVALALAFVVIVVAVGYALSVLFSTGGWAGMVIAVVVAAALAFASYWKSDAVALAMSRARPADPQEYRRLYNVVEGLSIAAGIPMPRVYIIDDVAPNAFATGRDPRHAAIAVTTGLLQLMNRVELEGVIAHELSHIRNYDILVSTLAVTMVGAIALMSDFGLRFLWWNGGRRGRNDRNNSNPAGFVLIILGFVLLLLAPIIARLMQLAISRRRESLADVSGVQLTRYPPGLISALEKLKADTTVTHSASKATAHLWIEQPVARVEGEGRMAAWNKMFDTHPPLDERIAALKEL
jgi:heat shock protein HtpX